MAKHCLGLAIAAQLFAGSIATRTQSRNHLRIIDDTEEWATLGGIIDGAWTQSTTWLYRKLVDSSYMAPLMDSTDRALLKRKFKDAKTYFEFGAGGSTVWAVATPNLEKIHTSENAVEWVKILQERPDIKTAVEAGRLVLDPIDLGPVKFLGYPQHDDPASQAGWGSYSDRILQDKDAHWDLIMVDGRFRVPCALKALQHIKDPSSTLLLIHDYERLHYHKVEEFADVVERGHHLVVLRKKADLDADKLAAAVQAMERDLL